MADEAINSANFSPGAIVWSRFKEDRAGLFGLAGVLFLFALAIFAPLIANGRPLLMKMNGTLSSPALRYIFAPDSTEVVVEKLFNYLFILLPLSLILLLVFRTKKNILKIALPVTALILLIPFLAVHARMDKTDWRKECSNPGNGGFAIFAPIPFGPFENVAEPHLKPDGKHIFGTDQIGRDVLSRMIYGARVSLAVGFLATGITMIIGVIVGLFCGYFGGRMDLITMRIVEVIMCFPTFLLLLILMAIMMDYKFEQSILLVIGVIGLTSWTGLTRIVRGEVLKQRAMSYIKSCESLGMPVRRIMLSHLLPNVMGPIFVSFTFGVAGAILAESGLSFLGFGVQAPSASWGELLRQAFSDPLRYWHLTLWPGLAIFIAVQSFNFAGDALQKAFDPKESL